MRRATTFFDDTNQPRHYNYNVEGGNYGRAQEFMGGPSIVEDEAAIYRSLPQPQPRASGAQGPWWAKQDDIVVPQRTTIFRDDDPYGGVQQVYQQERRQVKKELDPRDYELYRRYLKEARPRDVVTRDLEKETERDSMTSWSGRWRPRKDPYVQNLTEQRTVAYDRQVGKPVRQSGNVTRTVDYEPTDWYERRAVYGGM